MDALVRKDTHVKTGTGEHCPALVDTYACRLHKRPVIRRMASTSFSYGSKRAGRAWGSVCTLLLLLLLIFTATAHAVPPGTVIDNTAQALFRANGIDTTISSNSVSITTTWMRTPSQIELLQYAPSVGGAEQVLVPTTDYSPDGTTGGAPQTIAAVYPAGSTTPIDLSSAVPLVPVVYYHQGEPLFIRVVDTDQNIDPAVTETIWVQLTTPDLGDIELLLLTETEPDSGIFAGYMQSSGFGPVQAYNGLLDVTEGARISAQYIDAADSNDSVAASILVDPYGLVFDSSTGQPVDNATVTLVNAATGQPAVVYGDDGVSTFPSTVTSGGTFIDSSGKVYAFASGSYRFPFVAPGTYRLAVEPPSGYAAPSTVSTVILQTLPGAPFAIAEPGSRGEVFFINPGPALRIDIPVDPSISGLWILKSVNRDEAAIGDFLQYRLTIQNGAGLTASSLTIEDRLPLGFHYRQGSARMDGQAAGDPVISSDGRTLRFSLGDMPDGTVTELRYVTEIGAGARIGEAKNSARAESTNGLTSNTSTASVTVKDELWRSKNTIVGRVIADNCADTSTEEADGVPGVRIYLEDGTYVITDDQGMFHIEGVSSGAHVVQLDLESLPDPYEIFECESNTRAAGTPFSRFVEMQGGTLWRTDFHVKSKPPPSGEAALKMSCGLAEKRVNFAAQIDARDVDLSNVRLSIILPEGALYAPGSSRLASRPVDDPQVIKNVLIYRLGHAQAGRQMDLQFDVNLDGAAQPGRLHTRALLTFDTPSEKNRRTDAIDTVLALSEQRTREVQAPIIVRPQFESFSDVLLPEGRKVLDQMARQLGAFEIEHVVVVGHTDNLPIRTDKRHLFRDNQALSLARARKVAAYLADQLKLSSDQMTVSGRGDTQPLESNATEAGRAINRRVAVTVLSVKVKVVHDIATIKCEDQTSAATMGRRATSPAALPEQKPETPEVQDFSRIGIDTLSPGFGWLTPDERFYPSIPSIKIAVQHDPSEQVRVMLDGRELNGLTFEGTRVNGAGTVAVSYWAGVGIKDGANRLVAERLDASGNVAGRIERTVYYAGMPVEAEVIEAASQLIANGKRVPEIAVRLTDKDGHPARFGVLGEYHVLPPHEAYSKFDLMRDGLPQVDSQQLRYAVGRDGIARIRLQPTTRSGKVVVRLLLDGREEEVQAWLRPEAREWILVGLAEGTAGYNAASGNMEQLDAADTEEDFYKEGRLAFFAKGKIKGSWLLTAAYDSDKDRDDPDNRLFQTIDPESYYTLYGDTTQQQYEAASIRKLYLKIERDRFYAMFGDYDTGLTVTELSRYSRSFNGLKSEYSGDRFGYSLFATDTRQAYVKDEIQGNGTSGLYYLSRRNIVTNSDKVTIETRDRFRSEIILSSVSLTRFVDYSIDYDSGSLFFKSPVYSRDAAFNPIYIVVEYESENASDDSYTYGGRGSTKLFDDRIEVGATYIHEGPDNAEGDLGGLDAQVDLGKGFKVKAEVSSSRKDESGEEISGEGYLAELTRRTADFDGRVYYRELGEGFGLGQQNGSESATRKVGGDAAWRFKEQWTLAGEAYRSDNLATHAQRDLAEASLVYRNPHNTLSLGARTAEDKYDDGSADRSTQLLAGASRMFFDNRVQLRLNHEQSLFGDNDSVDFPTRTIIGADYKVAEPVTLFAEHEITRGESQDTQSSRVGFKATPWNGGQVGTSVGRESQEEGSRLFANLGLFQNWQINSRWSVDAGLDRSQTIQNEDHAPFDTDVPTAAGASEEFTAATLGLGYKAEQWSWTGRVESRWADTQDKWGLISGIAGEVRRGLGLSAGARVFHTETDAGEETLDGEVRLSMAWRPKNTTWIVFDRLDYKFESCDDAAGDIDARRIVNHFNANYKPADRLQMAFQYGAKYVFDTIDQQSYTGYTDLTGLEARYDLTSEWDVGLQASLLHSWNAGQMDYRTGVSVGYTMFKNAWVSLGYNFTGFDDEDFSAADYTAEGPFAKFRLKFDQKSVREMVDWFGR